MTDIALTTYIIGLVCGWFVAYCWYDNKYCTNIKVIYYDAEPFFSRTRKIRKILKED